MILFCALIAWGLTISGFLTICYNWQKAFKHLYQLHRVPCSKCQYFTNSCYLKCTVSPHLACTEQAIGCRDFTPMTATRLSFPPPQERLPKFRYILGDYHKNQ
jgi:hypothetical protein